MQSEVGRRCPIAPLLGSKRQLLGSRLGHLDDLPYLCKNVFITPPIKKI